MIKITESPLAGIRIIEPEIFGDNRGYFFEAWNLQKYEALGIHCNFVQDNESQSQFGVLRGLHYQASPYTQAKLVRVITGKVLDVAVDIRQSSPTYGQYVAVELSEENHRQIFIPRGFAHGFAVLSTTAILAYKCDNFYHPEADRGIKFDDPDLHIDWQIQPDQWILSAKDQHNPAFKAIQPWKEQP